MPQLLLALVRAFASLSRPGIWFYLLLPAGGATVVWLVAAWFWLMPLTDGLLAATPLGWLHERFSAFYLGWLISGVAFLGAWVVLLSGAMLIAVVLSGVWALPAMAARVAASDYPDVARRGEDGLWPALRITFGALLRYLLGWTLTLPVWLVPGMAVVHSLFWLAWLNRATFAHDALAAHVAENEWPSLKRRHGSPLWMLGLIAALLAHLPFVGLLAPALASLAFTHYGLQALRDLRTSGDDQVIDGEFHREA